jgi:hypothetical protein
MRQLKSGRASSREGMTPIVVSGAATHERNPALATDGAGTSLCVYDQQPQDATGCASVCARAIDARL